MSRLVWLEDYLLWQRVRFLPTLNMPGDAVRAISYWFLKDHPLAMN